MKHLFFLIFISTFFSCNSKKDNESSKISKESPKQEVQKRLAGIEIVFELEKMGFFALTDQSELDEVRVSFERSYTNLSFFQGKLREETGEFMDNRYHSVDCEELFEIGGLSEYLNRVKKTFQKLGLELEFENEKSEQNNTTWKHTIELNGNEYVAFNEQFSDLDWGIAYVNFIEMLNSELAKQGSDEQFFPISCGHDGAFVLLTPEQFDFVKRNYPNDEEHPATIGAWKNRNGL